MIIDCFIFNDELDMLELRLNTLNQIVDRFVLVEAAETFQGNPKPFVFNEHRDEPRFAPFVERITHLMLEHLPDYGTAWTREHAERNAIREALGVCDRNDIVLISDVDELPNPARIIELRHPTTLVARRVATFEQRLYSYVLNWRHVRPWYGTRAVRYGDLGEPQALRSTRAPRPDELVIRDGGWSFSSFGGVYAVRRKLEAFAHTACNRPEYLDTAYISQCIADGRGILPNDGNEYVWQDVDDSYPPYLLEHLDDTYADWLHERAIAKGWAV